jgi:hypothetical protein
MGFDTLKNNLLLNLRSQLKVGHKQYFKELIFKVSCKEEKLSIKVYNKSFPHPLAPSSMPFYVNSIY